MPLLVTAFAGAMQQVHEDKPIPPSPGEEEGKDGGTAEHLAALQRRLRGSEQTILKLQDEVVRLQQGQDAGEAQMRKAQQENQALQAERDAFESDLRRAQQENQTLREQLAERRPADVSGAGFGFELEEKDRLADRLYELEHERIVLAGMYRSATKRCRMLEQRLAARTQAALNLAIEGGRREMEGQAHPEAGNRSVNVFEDEEAVLVGQDGLCVEDNDGLWNAPDEEETREDDRWRRGDWGDGRLMISDLPLEQCRQLVTVSDNKLRVEDWVIRHACKFQQEQLGGGAYRHEPDLEGGSVSSSVCSSSSSHGGGLLSVTSSADSRRRGQDSKDAAESEVVRHVHASEGAPRTLPSNTLKHELMGYSTSQKNMQKHSMQVRANPMTGGVTRAAWKTPRLQPESQVQGIFNSLLGSATGVGGSPPSHISASVVQFGT